MNKWIVVVGLLVLVGLGLFFVSGMTGHVITGLVIGGGDEVKMESEYFRISDFGEGEREVGKDGKGRSG